MLFPTFLLKFTPGRNPDPLTPILRIKALGGSPGACTGNRVSPTAGETCTYRFLGCRPGTQQDMINFSKDNPSMKRSILLVALAAVALSACGKKEETATAPAPAQQAAPAPAPAQQAAAPEAKPAEAQPPAAAPAGEAKPAEGQAAPAAAPAEEKKEEQPK